MPRVKLIDTSFSDGISNCIKCRMVICRMTQQQLAEATGLSTGTISIRLHNPGTLRIDEIFKIAKALKTEPMKIITGVIQ